MKTIYLIANWKMNPTALKEAEALAGEVRGGVKKIKPKRARVVLCPPFPFLSALGRLSGGAFSIGGQDCYFEEKGAYTGEVSAKMLRGLCCEYVIIGHSERRQYFDETSELINKKLKAAFSNKMTPVLAVGEKEGQSVNVIVKQLKEALAGISEAYAKKLIIAYEPVWAIGTGKAATSDDAMTARLLIQKTLSELYSRKTAESVPVLYGGSTDAKNISTFIMEAGMQGALVGGASLKAEEFCKMVEIIG